MLSFKDNFEVNNEIKDVTKTFEAPEHILLIQFMGLEETACVLVFVSLSSQLQKTPEPPFLFETAGCSLGPSQPFFLCGSSLQPPCGLRGAFRSLLPGPPLGPLSPPPCLFLQSPQQNVML